MTILPDHGRAQDAPALFVVVGENGNGEYLVDTRTGSCECKDAKYRNPEGGCKHLRRCRIATSETAVPASALGRIEIDSTFGAQVDASAKFATADGGIIDGETGDILEEDTDECDSDPWSAPRPEIGEHGHTGAFVVECRDCEVEALEGRTQHASHFDGCSHE
jgi:hypothetical protein